VRPNSLSNFPIEKSILTRIVSTRFHHISALTPPFVSWNRDLLPLNLKPLTHPLFL
jgi:hypothetical protein